MTDAALAKVEQSGALAREQDLGISVEQIIKRVEKIREVRDRVMKIDVHFGKIPGVKKASLLKPGAETLCMAFQLVPKFSAVETRDGDHLECVVTCTLVHAVTRVELGDGIGSCSTRESKYAYRQGERTCPECGNATALRKSSKDKGGGFYCWSKIGGCGKQFDANDKRITEQQVGRQPNPDVADQYNTVRKMACKRAHIAATLFVTGASELFTQDVEDMPQHQRRVETPPDDDAPAAPQQRAGGGGSRQAAPPVQAVPTDEDLDRAIHEISEIQTVEGLGKHAAANRGKRWNKVQIEALKAASEKRRAELTDPEYRDGDADHGDHDEVP